MHAMAGVYREANKDLDDQFLFYACSLLGANIG